MINFFWRLALCILFVCSPVEVCGVMPYDVEVALVNLQFSQYDEIEDDMLFVANARNMGLKDFIETYHLLAEVLTIDKRNRSINGAGVRWLLEKNADINKGLTTSSKPPTTLIEDAINNGTFSWDKDLGEGNTMLHAAALGGNTDAVTWLISNGASIDVKNNAGATPLQGAITSLEADLKKTKQRAIEYLQVIRDLVNAGADMSAMKMDQKTRELLEKANVMKAGVGTSGIKDDKKPSSILVKVDVKFVPKEDVFKKLSRSLQAIANG